MPTTNFTNASALELSRVHRPAFVCRDHCRAVVPGILRVCAAHLCDVPSSELWKLLPPKTYFALRRHRTLTDGVLHRWKRESEELLHCALENMVLGRKAQGTISQWYLLRLFLNLPPALAVAAPCKDRSLTAAPYELKKHARQYSGWTVNRKLGPCGTIFADSFPMVKSASRLAISQLAPCLTW
ncbi:hypothetical protein PHYPSEUDO_001191 [Phytophthora pseudosyringae]|uniref:Uncharacterized protein n=1 Tax=Phytophthora pseudosyringae TaxID=221518 RepID=A0A8T1V3B2_9STRA|nr:hypothetical protein PHYPSEUDO_001191 [Phytophthora pseudosyringae]